MRNLEYCNLGLIKSRLPHEKNEEILERVLNLVLNHNFNTQIAYLKVKEELKNEN